MSRHDDVAAFAHATTCAIGATGFCTCGSEPWKAESAARDHDGFTPVFLFAHDYGTHLPYCEILQVETSIKCTCGFKEALEAALAAEALSRA